MLVPLLKWMRVMGMERGEDEGKRNKAICLTPSFITNLGGGREKKLKHMNH